MNYDALRRFFARTSLFVVLAFVVAAIVSPPDPFTLIMYGVPLAVLAPVASYFLTYKNGDAYLEKMT